MVLEEEVDPSYEPTDNEIEEYARWLGFDMDNDQDLLYLAREGLKAPLPPNWKPCKTTDTGEIYYFNFVSGESTWDHPCDDYYKKRYEEAKKKKRDAAKAAREENDDRKRREKESVRGIVAAQQGGGGAAAAAAGGKSELHGSSGGGAASVSRGMSPVTAPAGASAGGGLAPLTTGATRASSAASLGPVQTPGAANAGGGYRGGFLPVDSSGPIKALPLSRPAALPNLDDAPIQQQRAPLVKAVSASDAEMQMQAAPKRTGTTGERRSSDPQIIAAAAARGTSAVSATVDDDPSGRADAPRRTSSQPSRSSTEATGRTSRRTASPADKEDEDDDHDDDTDAAVIDTEPRNVMSLLPAATTAAAGRRAPAGSAAPAASSSAAEEASLRAAHAARMRRMVEEHDAELARLEAEHGNRVASTKESNAAQLKSFREAHEKLVASMVAANERDLLAAREQHAADMASLRASLQAERSAFTQSAAEDTRRARDAHAKELLDMSTAHARDVREERERADAVMTARRAEHDTAIRDARKRWQAEEEAAERAGRDAVAAVNAHYASLLSSAHADKSADVELAKVKSDVAAALERERAALAAAMHAQEEAQQLQRRADDQVREQAAAVAAMKEEHDTAQRALRVEMEAANASLNRERALVRDQHAEVAATRASLTAELLTLQSDVTATADLTSSLRRSTHTLRTGVAALYDCIHATASGLAVACDALAASGSAPRAELPPAAHAPAEGASIAHELDWAATMLRQLEAPLASWTSSMRTFLSNTAAANTTRAAEAANNSQQRIQHLHEQLATAQAAAAPQRTVAPTTEMAAAQTRIVLLESQITELQSSAVLTASQHARGLQEAQMRSDALSRQVAALTSALSERDADATRARDAAANERATASAKQSEIDRLTAQAAVQASQVTQLQSEVVALEQQLVAMRATSNTAAGSTQDMSELTQAHAESASLHAQLAALTEHCNTIQREHHASLDRVASVQMELAVSKREQAAAMMRIAQLQADAPDVLPPTAAALAAAVPVPAQALVVNVQPVLSTAASDSRPLSVRDQAPPPGDQDTSVPPATASQDALRVLIAAEASRLHHMKLWLSARRATASTQRDQLLKDRAQWKSDAKDVVANLHEEAALPWDAEGGDASLVQQRRKLLKRVKRELDAAAEVLNAFTLRVKASEAWISRRHAAVDRLCSWPREDADARPPLRPTQVLESWRTRAAWQDPGAAADVPPQLASKPVLTEQLVRKELERLTRDLELYSENMVDGTAGSRAAASVFERMPAALLEMPFDAIAATRGVNAASSAALTPAPTLMSSESATSLEFPDALMHAPSSSASTNLLERHGSERPRASAAAQRRTAYVSERDMHAARREYDAPPPAFMPPPVPPPVPAWPTMPMPMMPQYMYPWGAPHPYAAYAPTGMHPPAGVVYAAAAAPPSASRYARRSRRYVPSPGMFSPTDSDESVPIRTAKHVPHRPAVHAPPPVHEVVAAPPPPVPRISVTDAASTQWQQWADETRDVQRRVADHAKWLHSFRAKLGVGSSHQTRAGVGEVERLADPLAPPRMYGFDPHPSSGYGGSAAVGATRVHFALPSDRDRRLPPRSRSISPSELNASSVVAALVSPVQQRGGASRRQRSDGDVVGAARKGRRTDATAAAGKGAAGLFASMTP